MPPRQTTAKFIEKARSVHGDKYDYSKTEYTYSDVYVTITCPAHGDFSVIPYRHVGKSKAGCAVCMDNPSAMSCDQIKSRFVAKATEVHKGKYSYENVEYVSAEHRVSITCPKHGDFLQLPTSHTRGSGCKKCANDKLAQERSFTKEQFIEKARSVHGDKYDYSKVIYTNAGTLVTLICDKHGEFKQTPGNHVHGTNGCPHCGDRLWLNLPTKVYYIRFMPKGKPPVYKVGITTKSIEERYRTEQTPYEVIKTWQFFSGKVAFMMEQSILKYHKDGKCTDKVLTSGGNSELFIRDVLELDKDATR